MTTNNYLIILFCFMFLFVNCHDKKKNGVVSTNQLDESVSKLTELALKSGDTLAYDKLSIDYMDSPYENFLDISTKMANKHDYKSAYIDVFYCLTNYYQKKDDDLLKNLNDSLKTKAIKYLNLAAEKGEVNALEILSKFYSDGIYFEENKNLAKELLMKRDSILSTYDIKK